MAQARTFAGLDVHVAKIEGFALDLSSGECHRRSLPGTEPETLQWLQSLPVPLRATYEAGPTGFGLARAKGSDVHDELFYQAGRGFYRKSNNAGGIEGGMTNGEPIVVRAAVKPLASLRRPLKSVNIQTKEEMTAEIVRSDVCPVASAAVVGETVVAIALAEAVSEKFGSDSIREMRDNRDRYTAHLLDY
ncbi:MAG TPA: chorismate synthase [Elusimicrobiota bacterium]|nr:chorismate synthase [Elusimicrobiota bacterium]